VPAQSPLGRRCGASQSAFLSADEAEALGGEIGDVLRLEGEFSHDYISDM
jgi:hypothetical protein